MPAQHPTDEIGTPQFWDWLRVNEARLFTIADFLMADQDAALAVVENSIVKACFQAGRRPADPPAEKLLVLELAAAGLRRRQDGGLGTSLHGAQGGVRIG